MNTPFKHLDTATLPPEWSADFFENLVDFKPGKTPPRGNSIYWTEGKYPWVRISDMTPHGVITKTAEKISQEAYDAVFRGRLVPAGSLLMSFKLTIGRVSRLGIPAFHNEAIISFRSNQQTINEDFLRFYLSQINYKDYQDTAIKGKTLNKSKLNSLEIALPPLPEQKKIAHILSTVQRAIEAQERIIQTITELFKSMLHRLMTAQIRASNGDRSGEFYGGGRDISLPVDNYKFPFDWNIVTASEVANFTRGISWSKAEEASKDKGISVISIPNIKDGWIDYNSKFNHYLAKEVPKGKLLNIGDIVFVGSSGSVHNVGRNAQVKTLHNENVAFASFTFKACPKRDKIDEEFLYFLVNSDMVPFPDFCKRAADGKFNFQLRDFSSRLRIPLPPLTEQKKIARILSTVRQKIDNAQFKKSKLQELFRTLLHELMTAKIRVHAIHVPNTIQ